LKFSSFTPVLTQFLKVLRKLKNKREKIKPFKKGQKHEEKQVLQQV